MYIHLWVSVDVAHVKPFEPLLVGVTKVANEETSLRQSRAKLERESVSTIRKE